MGLEVGAAAIGGCTCASDPSPPASSPPSTDRAPSEPASAGAPDVDPPQWLPPPASVDDIDDTSIDDANGRVAQLTDAETERVLAHAAPVEGPVTRGLLACRVTLRGETDDGVLDGGSDVALILRQGTLAPRMTPRRASRTFTLPVRDLAVGTGLDVEVVDEDLGDRERILFASVRYERAPFEVEGPGGRVTCRALTDVAGPAGQALSALEAAIARYEEAPPSLADLQLGGAAEHVRDAAREAAAWIVPEEATLVAALARSRAADGAFVARVGARVTEELTTLPAAGEDEVVSDYRMRLSSIVCDDDARTARQAMGEALFSGAAPRCHAVLEWTIPVAGSLPGASALEEEAWTLREDGRRERARRLPASCDGHWSRAGETVTLPAHARCEIHLGLSEPEGILRVGPPLLPAPVLLRLAAPPPPPEETATETEAAR